VQRRFQQWRALPPEQRARLSDQMHRFRQLPPSQQDQLRATLQRYNQLSPEQQRRLRMQFKNMSAEQRRRALRRSMR